MRLIANFVLMVEEASRSYAIVSYAIEFLLRKCAADYMWSPLKIILFHPGNSLFYSLVIYIVFVIIFMPFLLLSYLTGTLVSVVVFFGSIVLGLRSFARTMTFPGSTSSMQRDIAVDFLKRVSIQLEKIATLSSEMMSFLLLVGTSRKNNKNLPGNVRLGDMKGIEKKYMELSVVLGSLPKFTLWLTRATDACSDKLSNDETKLMKKMVDSMSALLTAHAELSPIVMSVVKDCYNNCTSPLLDRYLDSCAKCLQASEQFKTCAVAIRPQSGSKNDGDDPIWNQLSAIMPRYVVSYEHLSFAVMREQLYSNYNAVRLKINGGHNGLFSNSFDNHMIDSVYIPSTVRYNTPVSPVGTVIMCSPNAGLYELVSQQSADTSWVGVYTKLGYDVCVFNYGGYNESTGVPTPYRMKQDGLAVLNYLVEMKNVRSVIVHGESVGGMIASHMARYSVHRDCIRLLVCDKSFGSLDAVASRLMGTWASLGLRYLGQWYTNVVFDYLAAPCPKLMFQDPNDEIISHGASLKVGVALMLVKGDRYFLPVTLPIEYNIAHYLQEAPPHTEEPIPEYQPVDFDETAPPLVCNNAHGKTLHRLLLQSYDFNTQLPNDFFSHFGGCVLFVGRMATKIVRRRRKLSRDVDVESSGNGHNASTMQDGSGSLANRSPRGLSVKSSGTIGEHFQGQTALEILAEHSANLSISFLEELWMVIARADGGTGQLLGHACHQGFDGLQAWVCAAIVYNQNVASYDPQLGVDRMSIAEVAKELLNMVYLGAPDANGCILKSSKFLQLPACFQNAIIFIMHGLQVVANRCAAVKRNNFDGLFRCAEVSSLAPRMNMDVIFTNSCMFASLMYQWACCALKSEPSRREKLFEMSAANDASGIAESYGLSPTDTKLGCGRIISVHAGHNGWLHLEQLNEYKRLLDILVRRPNNR